MLYKKNNDLEKLFKKDMDRIPKMDPDQAIEIFKRINSNKLKIAQLQKEINSDQPDTETHQIMNNIATLEDAIRTDKKILESDQHLVFSVAYKFKGSGLELTDLIYDGFFGLRKAIDKFKVDKDFMFSTYATKVIHNNIILGLREKRLISLPADIHKGISNLKKAGQILTQKYGRDPHPEEYADHLKIPVEHVRLLLLIEGGVINSLDIFSQYNKEDDESHNKSEGEVAKSSGKSPYNKQYENLCKGLRDMGFEDEPTSKHEVEPSVESGQDSPALRAKYSLGVNSPLSIIMRNIHRLSPIVQGFIRDCHRLASKPYLLKNYLEKEYGVSSQQMINLLQWLLKYCQSPEGSGIQSLSKVKNKKWSGKDFDDMIKYKLNLLNLIPGLIPKVPVLISKAEKEYGKSLLGSHQFEQWSSWSDLYNNLTTYPPTDNGKLLQNISTGPYLQEFLEGQIEIVEAMVPKDVIIDIIEKLSSVGVRINMLQNIFLEMLTWRSIFLLQKYLYKKGSTRRMKGKDPHIYDIPLNQSDIFKWLLAGFQEIAQAPSIIKDMLNRLIDDSLTFLKPIPGAPTKPFLYYPLYFFAQSINNDTCNYKKRLIMNEINKLNENEDKFKGKEINKQKTNIIEKLNKIQKKKERLFEKLNEVKGDYHWDEIFKMFNLLFPTIVVLQDLGEPSSALRKHALPERMALFEKWLEENKNKYDENKCNVEINGLPLFAEGIGFIYQMNTPETGGSVFVFNEDKLISIEPK